MLLLLEALLSQHIQGEISMVFISSCCAALVLAEYMVSPCPLLCARLQLAAGLMNV